MKLKNAKTFRFATVNRHYLISYDYGSGKKQRYTVIVIDVDDKTEVIGRELPLGYSKKVILRYEKKIKEDLKLRYELSLLEK